MFKKLIVNIVNSFWRFVYGEWTRAEVEKLYESIPDVRALEQFLLNHKFEWRSDGLNACMELDTFARPEQTLARGWGNCGDFLRLYEDFLKFKKQGRFAQYELTTPTKILGIIPSKRWHYASLIDGIYIQSNVRLYPLINGSAAESLSYYFGEYSNIRIIDEWRS